MRAALAPAQRWLAGGRLVDWLVILLIAAYVVASLPGLTRWPPLVNDEGREANLFWVASGADPTAERMNAHRGFPTWGNGGLQGFTAAVIFRLAGLGVSRMILGSPGLAEIERLGTDLVDKFADLEPAAP